MSEIKISEMQKKVLAYLATICHQESNTTFFKFIARETNLEIRQVRIACRALARKGLTEYNRTVFDGDGMVAGSGYSCTEKGYDLIVELGLLGKINEE